MSNTEQAQEPTMEEILASIRRIISDDTEAASSDEAEPEDAKTADKAEAEPDPAPGESAQEPEEAEQIDFDVLDVEDDTGAEDDDILELTEVIDDPPAAEEEPAAEEQPVVEEPAEDADDIAFLDIEDTSEPELASEPAEDVVAEDAPSEERIMSEVTDAAVANAFGQLASTLLSRDGSTRTLEELVQEMLRPMLKSWLDENLPAVVEQLVRQEIERASRRGSR